MSHFVISLQRSNRVYRIAIGSLFFMLGLSFATWASRIPSIQQQLNLSDSQVYNNIQKYGNTTAASIPLALCEAWESGKVKSGDLVCLAAFGSGFTWASALLKW